MNHTLDLSHVTWRKSRHSDGGANNCVEIAEGVPALVPVRDSKVPDGSVIVFGAVSWTAFLTDLVGGRS